MRNIWFPIKQCTGHMGITTSVAQCLHITRTLICSNIWSPIKWSLHPPVPNHGHTIWLWSKCSHPIQIRLGGSASPLLKCFLGGFKGANDLTQLDDLDQASPDKKEMQFRFYACQSFLAHKADQHNCYTNIFSQNNKFLVLPLNLYKVTVLGLQVDWIMKAPP